MKYLGHQNGLKDAWCINEGTSESFFPIINIELISNKVTYTLMNGGTSESSLPIKKKGTTKKTYNTINIPAFMLIGLDQSYHQFLKQVIAHHQNYPPKYWYHQDRFLLNKNVQARKVLIQLRYQPPLLI